MKAKIISLLITPILAVSTGALALSSYCPAPNQITIHTIAHSVNAYYTANVNGISFAGYDAGGLAAMPKASFNNPPSHFYLPFKSAMIKGTPGLAPLSPNKADQISCFYGTIRNGSSVGITLYAGIGSQKTYNAKFTSTTSKKCTSSNGFPSACTFNVKL